MTWACVDIGGTKVAVALACAHDGRVHWLGRWSEPTCKQGDDTALAAQVLRLIDQACAATGTLHIESVGVSSCGPFVLQGGAVALATPNICGGLAGPLRGLPNTWMHAPLEAPLRARGWTVHIANDAVAALAAERLWGALQGIPDCAYLTWSTGIGAGLCVDGRILRGKNANAGHLGHSFVSDGPGALCGCGNLDDVEALVGGNALARRFGMEAPQLIALARAGEAHALAIVDELCRVLGRAVYNLVALLDLQAISFGGSIMVHHHELLLPRLRAQLHQRLPALTDTVQLLPAGLGERVGDCAALALVAPEGLQL